MGHFEVFQPGSTISVSRWPPRTELGQRCPSSCQCSLQLSCSVQRPELPQVLRWPRIDGSKHPASPSILGECPLGACARLYHGVMDRFKLGQPVGVGLFPFLQLPKRICNVLQFNAQAVNRSTISSTSLSNPLRLAKARLASSIWSIAPPSLPSQALAAWLMPSCNSWACCNVLSQRAANPSRGCADEGHPIHGSDARGNGRLRRVREPAPRAPPILFGAQPCRVGAQVGVLDGAMIACHVQNVRQCSPVKRDVHIILLVKVDETSPQLFQLTHGGLGVVDKHP